ncbi:hypothetical protein Clacol_006483 [Clathrus columnatus]|uniref:Programmed cell death protein 5 n=1 Tax=Clathrus columnatus TaxID=1419009 RepID=A0AAV5AC70_9AGAM|nr:hypothetical protein Clacol_006483 [Clathrus columnatus]
MDEQQRAALASIPNQSNPQDDRKEEEEQMRRDLLATVLDAAARERLSRIALVSPSRSRQIEGILLRMAQTGQLRGRVTEQQLIELLEQAENAQASTTAKKPTIIVSEIIKQVYSPKNFITKYQRRNADEEDDDWNFGL